jgi:hypothetical protein
VPFEVIGELGTDARLQVYDDGPLEGEVFPAGTVADSRTVVVPAGSTGGAFAVEYSGDERDSISPRVVAMLGHGVSEVLVRDPFGVLTIVDDDPSPRMRFSTPDDVVVEGDTTKWVIRLKEKTRRGLQVGLQPVAGDGTPLRTDDLPRRWVSSHVFVPAGSDGGNPFVHETLVDAWGYLDNGNPEVVVEVPIRDDSRREPAETLTFRAVTNTGWRSRPITVTVRGGR